MQKNTHKIAIRNFLKERYYSLINVFGLAIGVASAFLIAQYIVNEMSFDKHHPDVDQLYRVNQTNIWSPDGGVMGSTVLPMAEAMKDEFPEVIETLRINTPNAQYVRPGNSDQAYLEEGILAADSTFFDFFGFQLAEGDPNTALDKINSVVLTHEMAIKYFGTADALGKTILLGDRKRAVKVTGVLKKEQKNTHFDFDLLLSIYTNPNVKRFEWSWIWTQVVTYVKIKGDTPEQSRLDQIAPKYAAGAFRRLGMELSEFEKEKGKITFYLQPVKDIHLYSGAIENRIGKDNQIFYIYVFGCVGLIVILLAAINFVNLSTARAASRAKEIGVKKVLGSSRKRLIQQLLLESIIISALATIIGLGMAELLRVAVVDVLGVSLSFGFSDYPQLFWAVIAIPFVLGFLAGVYPAFYLTSFKPVDVLKGKKTKGKDGAFFRNGLVVFQFTIAIALIISTLVINQQLKFFQDGNMGFKRDNILVIENTQKLGNSQKSFKTLAEQNAYVKNVAITSVIPGMGGPEDIFYSPENPDRKISLGTLKGDKGYLESLNIGLLAGRNFTDKQPEKNNIILNEMAMRSFGWSLDDAVGKKVSYFGDEYTVIGIMKNFHSLPFYYPIAPLILLDLDANMFNSSQHMLLTIDMANKEQLLNNLENQWASINSDVPFSYNFLDENLAGFYQSEQVLSKLFSIFTTLAIVIALIGLIGLTVYITSQRIKEIGVRKVLGASVVQLTLMVNSKFSKLIFVSCLLAVPIAWWCMTQWLQQFQYHITLSWVTFAVAVAVTMLIAWAAVSYNSIKASLMNPVDTLRDE